MYLPKHLRYFTSSVNREVKEIYEYSLVYTLALSLVFIFEPIYLWSLNYSLIDILLFYLQIYVWYAVLISVGARFASRFGYKHSLLVSNVFYVLYWLALFSIKSHPMLFFAAPVIFALQKSWLWPAYDADMSLNSGGRQQGRETGALISMIQMVFVIGPFLGGAVVAGLGFKFLFGLSAALMLLSAYPLFKSPEIYSRHEFRFKNAWRIFRQNTSNFFGYWGYAEDLMLQSLWPVYMFAVIPNFVDVGTVSTIAALVGSVVMLYVGRLGDKQDKKEIILKSSVFYGVTWVLRFLAIDVPGVVLFETLTKPGKAATDVSMRSLTFEKGAGRGPDYAIAYNVFYEFSLAIGKIVTCLAAIAILAFTGNVYLVFALAGILTMFYGFLK